MEIRGSPDINCCAVHVRMFCRTVSEALRNAVAVWTSASSPGTVILVRGVNSLDHIMGNH